MRLTMTSTRFVFRFHRLCVLSLTAILSTRSLLQRNRSLTRTSVLVLFGAALFFSSARPARMANSIEQVQKVYSYTPVTALSGAYKEKLLSEPLESALQCTAEQQSTVNVSVLHQQPQSTGAPVNREAGIMLGAGIVKNDRKAVQPADTALPDPTVVLLPTPLELKSPTDIPDFSMAASDQFIVTANSQTIYFQDDASNILKSSTLAGFFASLGPSSVFGPHILYDDMTSHFVITALDGFLTSHSSVLLGVSDTADPTATWTLYKFLADPQGQTSAGDMSSIGVNSTWIVVSTAMFQNALPNGFASSTLFVLDKASLVMNKHLTMNSFTDPGFLPCPTKGYDTQFPYLDIFTDWNGNSSGKGVIRHGFIGTNAGQLRYIQSLEFLSFSSTWDSFAPAGKTNFVPQLGSSTGIYGGDGRITNAVFRNNTLYGVHSVYRPAGSPDHMAVHWFTEDAVSGAGRVGLIEAAIAKGNRLVPRSNRSDPAAGAGGPNSYFNPSVGVSSSFDWVIGCTQSSETQYAIPLTFRVASADSTPGKFLFDSPVFGPSLHLRNGINFGGTNPVTSITQQLSRQQLQKWTAQFSAGSSVDEILIEAPKLSFVQGTIAVDNGSAAGAIGAPQGTPTGQFIFGNLFPSSIVGGQTLNGMQFFIPSITGSVQPGETVNLYYGIVSSTLNSASLTMQPYTVGLRDQFVTVNLPQPIQVPAGQRFFAGISGPGGKTWIGVDTNLPQYGTANSSPNGITNFSADPVNFMVRLTSPPPCHVELDGDEGTDTSADGGTDIVTGLCDCKPTAFADVDWITVDSISIYGGASFAALYTVKPNTSLRPRVGLVMFGDQTVVVRQAGNNPLLAVTATPNSTPAGGTGFKMTVIPAGLSSNSSLAPSAAGFTRTTTVAWNGHARPTTMVSPTQLVADISAADIATAGSAQITVFDLAPGGGTSPPVTFTITAAGPDFSITFDSSTATAQAGTKARVTVNITRTGGFTGNITVTPPDPQSGIKPKPPDPVTTTGNSVVFKLKISGGTPPGSYQLLFKGKDDSGRERDVTLTLVVTT